MSTLRFRSTRCFDSLTGMTLSAWLLAPQAGCEEDFDGLAPEDIPTELEAPVCTERGGAPAEVVAPRAARPLHRKEGTAVEHAKVGPQMCLR